MSFLSASTFCDDGVTIIVFDKNIGVTNGCYSFGFVMLSVQAKCFDVDTKTITLGRKICKLEMRLKCGRLKIESFVLCLQQGTSAEGSSGIFDKSPLKSSGFHFLEIYFSG